MNLENLKESVSEMSTEELIIHLKELRKKRRNPSEEKITKSIRVDDLKVSKKRKASKKAFENYSADMSIEEIQEFLKKKTGGLK